MRKNACAVGAAELMDEKPRNSPHTTSPEELCADKFRQKGSEDDASTEVLDIHYLGCVDGFEYAEVPANSLRLIVDFLKKCFPRCYSTYIDSYFKLRPAPSVLQATDEGAIIGCIVYSIDERKQGNIAYIAVDVIYRKLGIASNLLKFALDLMVTANEVILQTEYNNRPSLRLYSKFGFKQIRTITKYYPNGVNAIQMKLVRNHFQPEPKT